MAGSAWTNQVQNQVIVGGANGGVFVYSGTPGAGNLIASITNATRDLFGNQTLPGVTSYFPGTLYALQTINNEIVLWTSITTQAGPYTRSTASIAFNAFPDSITIGSALLSESGTVSNPSLLITDTWHDLRPLNTGFTGSVAGFWPPQYWLNASGAVELFGTVGLPSTGFNGVTWGTIALGWRPAVPSFIPVSMISNAGSAPGNSQGQYVEVGTDGSLQFHGLPSGAGAGPVSFQGWWPLSSGPITS